jgi:hypothetical protein
MALRLLMTVTPQVSRIRKVFFPALRHDQHQRGASLDFPVDAIVAAMVPHKLDGGVIPVEVPRERTHAKD